MYTLPEFPLAVSSPQHFSDLCAVQGHHPSLWESLSDSVPQASLQRCDPHCQPTTASSASSFTPSPKIIPVVCPELVTPVHLPHNTHCILLPASVWPPYCSSKSCLHAVVRPSTLPLMPCRSPIALPFWSLARDNGLGHARPSWFPAAPISVQVNAVNCVLSIQVKARNRLLPLTRWLPLDLPL